MSQAIRNSQIVMAHYGHYKGRLDNLDGPQTQAAAESVRRIEGLNWSRFSKRRKAVAAMQFLLNAAGHPAGAVDGIPGPNTNAALASWHRAQSPSAPVAAPTPSTPTPNSGLRRIVLHWTAGANRANGVDRRAYHFVIEGDGKIVDGVFKPEANIRPQRGKYAPHTLNLNSGSIGVSLAGMHGARERPFDAGPHAIKPAQVDAMVKLVARLCRQYGIPVTRQTVLSHAEVQTTLGVTQRGKWDFIWLPGFSGPGDAVAIGDQVRKRIQKEMGA